jgi:1-deoxy-D-xylulose-5-phosphate reductoisomerase
MNQHFLRDVTVLGSTGSIGQNTLDVIARHPDRYVVHALSAHSNMQKLAEQALQHRVACVVVPDPLAAHNFDSAWALHASLQTSLHAPLSKKPEVRVGAQALVHTAAEAQGQTVMAAIVGAAGLPAALAAAQAGKRVLLANKEALVAAGAFFMQAVCDNQAELLPIDSEHNAIFQCLPHHDRQSYKTPGGQNNKGVTRLILTASGGPFRQHAPEALQHVTPDQACAHPNWRMGRKISVDSATMLNKGLEIIEAHWLFSMPADQIDVVIHPQSIVHSMVQYSDGSVLAQMGNPDMRTPIAYGLGFPDRIAAGVSPLDLAAVGKLEFEAVDFNRYPCLKLAYQALRSGQTACVALNASNEIAVEAFLTHQLSYLDISKVVAQSLDWQVGQGWSNPTSIDDVLHIDQAVRTFALEACQRNNKPC